MPLATLTRRANIAIVLIAHTRKSAGASADDQVMGSRAFTGLARSVLHVMPDPKDTARRLLLAGKNNLASPPPGLAFTIGGDPVSISWSNEPVAITADEASAALASNQTESRTELAEAVDWLHDLLADGPLPASDATAAAEQEGFSKATLRRAKKELGIKAAKRGFQSGWEWSLPDQRAHEGAHPSEVSAFEAPQRLNGLHPSPKGN